MTLQTISVEYRVPGALDGLTPAPEFSLDPGAPNHIAPDEDNIYVVNVEDNLGLIDPTFLGGIAYADRFIKWVVIYSEALPVGDENIRVVTRDEDGNLVIVSSTVTPNGRYAGPITVPAVTNGLYLKRCLMVPQGGLLQVRNMVGSPGSPVVVRLGIWRPNSLDALAQIRKACCCRDDAPASVTFLPIVFP